MIKGIAVNKEVQMLRQICLFNPLSFHSNLQPESPACLLLPQAMLCSLYLGNSGLIFPRKAVEIFISISSAASP